MKKLSNVWKEKNAKLLEERLLDYDTIQTDPFRLIKVSYFMPVSTVQTRIVYAMNIKKKSGGEAKGPSLIVEVTLPETLFRGTIVVEEPLSPKVINKPIKLEDLLQSSRVFYSGEHKREQRELKTVGVSEINVFFGKDSIPIRIGRHSGAESVTIEGHRHIKIMGEKGKPSSFKDHATTIWLASEQSKPQTVENCKPFGWAVLGEVTEEVEEEFKEIEAAHYKENQLRQAQQEKQTQTHFNSLRLKSPFPPTQKPVTVTTELWSNATLTWNPGNQTLTAMWEKKTATARDKGFVPESLHKNLFEKRKSVTATVTVEPYGNAFRIVLIK